jgi:hypothetical protein
MAAVMSAMIEQPNDQKPDREIDVFVEILRRRRVAMDAAFEDLMAHAALRLRPRLQRFILALAAERRMIGHIFDSMRTRMEHAEGMVKIQRHRIDALRALTEPDE